MSDTSRQPAPPERQNSPQNQQYPPQQNQPPQYPQPQYPQQQYPPQNQQYPSYPVAPGEKPWFGPEDPATRQKANAADIVVSIVLMLIGICVAGLGLFATMFLVMMSDACGSTNQCDTDLMNGAWWAALVLPPVIFLAAIVWTIVRLRRRRTAWWVPFSGGLIAIAVWWVAATVMSGAAGHLG